MTQMVRHRNPLRRQPKTRAQNLESVSIFPRTARQAAPKADQVNGSVSSRKAKGLFWRVSLLDPSSRAARGGGSSAVDAPVKPVRSTCHPSGSCYTSPANRVTTPHCLMEQPMSAFLDLSWEASTVRLTFTGFPERRGYFEQVQVLSAQASIQDGRPDDH
jgi:hypothetical protein